MQNFSIRLIKKRMNIYNEHWQDSNKNVCRYTYLIKIAFKT